MNVNRLLVLSSIGLTLLTSLAVIETRLFLLAAPPVCILIVAAGCLYRPRENHLGVIYRNKRFARFVEPDKYELLMPFFERVQQEFDLDAMSTTVELANVLTRDRIPVDLELRISFHLDPRLAESDYRLEGLRRSEYAWKKLVAGRARDITLNTVLVENDFDYLISKSGRGHLKRALCALLSAQLKPLGVVIHPTRGVMISTLLPNRPFQEALQEKSAASYLGDAAVERMRPIVSQARQGVPGAAWESVLLGTVSAIARDGQIPAVLHGPGRLQRSAGPVIHVVNGVLGSPGTAGPGSNRDGLGANGSGRNGHVNSAGH